MNCCCFSYVPSLAWHVRQYVLTDLLESHHLVSHFFRVTGVIYCEADISGFLRLACPFVVSFMFCHSGVITWSTNVVWVFWLFIFAVLFYLSLKKSRCLSQPSNTKRNLSPHLYRGQIKISSALCSHRRRRWPGSDLQQYPRWILPVELVQGSCLSGGGPVWSLGGCVCTYALHCCSEQHWVHWVSRGCWVRGAAES